MKKKTKNPPWDSDSAIASSMVKEATKMGKKPPRNVKNSFFFSDRQVNAFLNC